MIFQTNSQFVVGSARCADRTPQRGVPTIQSVSENVAAGVPPAVEAGILPPGQDRLPRGNTPIFYQINSRATLFPPGGTPRLYVSQDGRHYNFQTGSQQTST